MLVLEEEELLSMPPVTQCFPSDSMKPEKSKKRPSKAKLAKRQKSPSNTSFASSGKIRSAAEVFVDVPATPLIWSTTGLTDNDTVEGNAAMSSEQTGRSYLGNPNDARRHRQVGHGIPYSGAAQEATHETPRTSWVASRVQDFQRAGEPS
ncbi:hypothetical protein MRX96_032042 [Rhipicephalus microplus]